MSGSCNEQRRKVFMADRSGTGSRVSINDVAEKLTRGNRVGGIIVAICMVVLGIMLMIWPLRTGYAMMVVATIGFIVYGIYQIIVYIRTPSDYKNGWTLANGIIYTILGLLILSESGESMFLTFAFLLGFLALYGGITQCATYGIIKKSGEPGAGWVLASGIMNIIMGIFFLITPFAATWAIDYVLGIYLVIGGIALFAEASSGHLGIRH